MRPDKKKVVDEVWDDARVQSFLAKEPPPGGDSRDFHRLLIAYRNMRPDDFVRFLGFFVADGGNLQATDVHGRTLAERISGHRQSGPFLDALVAVRSD